MVGNTRMFIHPSQSDLYRCKEENGGQFFVGRAIKGSAVPRGDGYGVTQELSEGAVRRGEVPNSR